MQTVEGEEVGEAASRKAHRCHRGRRAARLLARKEGVKHAHPAAPRDRRAQNVNSRVTAEARFPATAQVARESVHADPLTGTPWGTVAGPAPLGRSLRFTSRCAVASTGQRWERTVRTDFLGSHVGLCCRSAVGEPCADCCPDGLSSTAPTVRKGRGAGLLPTVPSVQARVWETPPQRRPVNPRKRGSQSACPLFAQSFSSFYMKKPSPEREKVSHRPFGATLPYRPCSESLLGRR